MLVDGWFETDPELPKKPPRPLAELLLLDPLELLLDPLELPLEPVPLDVLDVPVALLTDALVVLDVGV